MSGFGWELVTEADEDNVEGDLAIRGGRFARLSSFGDSVAQAVRVRLRWWRGHWFLDLSKGVPYLEQLFVRGVSDATIRAVLRREVLDVAGVARVDELRVTRDRQSRRATVSMRVVTTEGEVIPITDAPVGAVAEAA